MNTRAAASFVATMVRSRRRSREGLMRWQTARLDAWLQEYATNVPAYAALTTEVARDGLAALPIVDKTDMMRRFEDFNRLGLTADAALQMAQGAAAPRGHFVGSSTGTMGPKQPYLISDRDRQVWLGTVLAKTLGFGASRRPRVAIVLPRGSALYDAAGAALPLCFVPIGNGFDAVAETLVAFAPTAIVAPPRALRWLAEAGTRIAPTRLFSAAEVLDPMDRAAITDGFPNARLGQIYMGTEGLFAVTCRHGRLHLAEDRVHFELEPVGDGLVNPIITDFTRHAQIMARYRMNDMLRLGGPCPCGSPMQVVNEVLGRCDDAFELGGVTITPDILRDAVLAAGGAGEFRVHQTGGKTIEVILPPGSASAVASLRAALQKAGAVADITERFEPLPLPTRTKLRRVERLWRD